MCGRFTLKSSPQALAERFQLDEVPPLEPRFNIAPSQPIAAVRQRASGGRVLELRRWGLIPPWARDPAIGTRLINARAETLAEKPAYRDAFRCRRCLVPADGFYEWAEGSGPRQPYYVGLADGSPFAIAGLWERWRGPGGELLESCTLVTTAANDRVRSLHDRMPAILGPGDWAPWLDPALQRSERLLPLLRSAAAEPLVVHPVSRRVNDPKHDDPACIEPIELPVEPARWW